jgi:hypothetical protein
MNLLNTKIQTIEGVSRTETFIFRPTNRQTDSALRNNNAIQNKIIKKAISFINETVSIHTKEIIKLTLF